MQCGIEVELWRVEGHSGGHGHEQEHVVAGGRGLVQEQVLVL